MNHLDRYLLEFEARVKERGGHVYWAETAEDARRYIADLAARSGVRTVVKSKSMVTEEIDLTPYARESKASPFTRPISAS